MRSTSVPSRMLLLACLALAGCNETAPTQTESPRALRPPAAKFVYPADSQTVEFRIVFMHVDSVLASRPRRAIFYVDGEAAFDAVDNCPPWEYSTFDTTWTHGSWHTLSAVIQDSSGELSYSDTLDVLFLPRLQYDTLIYDVRYDDYMNKAYAVTRLDYVWADHVYLEEWFDYASDGNFEISCVTGWPEQNAINKMALPAGAYWLGGTMDSSTAWRWDSGEPWIWERWTGGGGAPSDLNQRGLLMTTVSGLWQSGSLLDQHPIVFEIDWSAMDPGGYR